MIESTEQLKVNIVDTKYPAGPFDKQVSIIGKVST